MNEEKKEEKGEKEKKVEVILRKDAIYSWKEMSLWDFIQEGNVPDEWNEVFTQNVDMLHHISEHLQKAAEEDVIYPPLNDVFRAFTLPPKDVRVVILGMDPYHNPQKGCSRKHPYGSAIGLCFSVRKGNTINSSLKSMYNELKSEGYHPAENGDITHWMRQGCLLLNLSLSVESGDPGSHTKYWKPFTKKVVRWLCDKFDNIVWLLWGSDAHSVVDIVYTNSTHKIIGTSHPSGYSCYRPCGRYPAFRGSGCFKECNRYLEGNPIVW